MPHKQTGNKHMPNLIDKRGGGSECQSQNVTFLFSKRFFHQTQSSDMVTKSSRAIVLFGIIKAMQVVQCMPQKA